jgi:hypothetical protein
LKDEVTAPQSPDSWSHHPAAEAAGTWTATPNSAMATNTTSKLFLNIFPSSIGFVFVPDRALRITDARLSRVCARVDRACVFVAAAVLTIFKCLPAPDVRTRDFTLVRFGV